VNAAEFTKWEERKKTESDDLITELAALASQSREVRGFVEVLDATLEIEKQKAMTAFMANDQEKTELKALLKGFDTAKRLINDAIAKE